MTAVQIRDCGRPVTDRIAEFQSWNPLPCTPNKTVLWIAGATSNKPRKLVATSPDPDIQQERLRPTMNIEAIARHLAEVGYVVLDQPLARSQSAQLSSRCQDAERPRFQPARIGRGAERQQLEAIRGDVISWLDDGVGIDHAYLAWMEKLRNGLNEALYLGLFDYECHYAIYREGAGYARHSDVLIGRRNRVLSTVFYLNEDWQLSDGGELVLFAPEGDAIIETVTPTFGKMIMFLSGSFPHAVLTARKQRRSIAGWFRGRDID